MTSETPKLSVNALHVRFGARRVLCGLSFDVRRGEVFGILGPNGAGKTTLFHVLSGLEIPESGTLSLDGSLLSQGDRSLRRAMGVVFQHPSLDRRLTVMQNLLLAASLYRVTGAAAAVRARELLAMSELADRASDFVEQLSGGMQQRVELCRALMAAPQILLLDEPTRGFDERSFQKTWQQLLSLRSTLGSRSSLRRIDPKRRSAAIGSP
jgi:ABC-2 type transport system ATP-binding protein